MPGIWPVRRDKSTPTVDQPSSIEDDASWSRVGLGPSTDGRVQETGEPRAVSGSIGTILEGSELRRTLIP